LIDSSLGRQVSSRIAARYRSVASIDSVVESSSIRTPVSIGIVSSRPAATATWATARAKPDASMCPAISGIGGNVG